jgi:hypothetical protein
VVVMLDVLPAGVVRNVVVGYPNVFDSVG